MRVVNKNKLQEVLDYVKTYQAENGLSPSFRQITHNVAGLSLGTAHSYVNILERQGLIKKTNNGNIAIPTRLSKGSTIIAPMIGSVACGPPIFAEQNIEETYQLPVSLFGDQKLYALRAQGDSMKFAGIFHGDTVFYLPCNDADNGEIVVALIDNEATIKRLEKKKGYALLHPENPDFEDIKTDHLVIQGIVKHVIHSFK